MHFDEQGFPDFTPYELGHTRLKKFNGRTADMIDADKQFGIPRGYRADHSLTWHHKEDGRTMQLVPEDLHDAVRHTGGIAAEEDMKKWRK